MASRIDWSKLLILIKKKDRKFKTKIFYPEVCNCIITLTKLQNIIMRTTIPMSLYGYLHEDISGKEDAIINLWENKTLTKPKGHKKSYDCHTMIQLSKLVIATEKKLHSYLINRNNDAIRELKSFRDALTRLRTNPFDEESRSTEVYLKDKLKCWDVIRALIPILNESLALHNNENISPLLGIPVTQASIAIVSSPDNDLNNNPANKNENSLISLADMIKKVECSTVQAFSSFTPSTSSILKDSVTSPPISINKVSSPPISIRDNKPVDQSKTICLEQELLKPYIAPYLVSNFKLQTFDNFKAQLKDSSTKNSTGEVPNNKNIEANTSAQLMTNAQQISPYERLNQDITPKLAFINSPIPQDTTQTTPSSTSTPMFASNSTSPLASLPFVKSIQKLMPYAVSSLEERSFLYEGSKKSTLSDKLYKFHGISLPVNYTKFEKHYKKATQSLRYIAEKKFEKNHRSVDKTENFNNALVSPENPMEVDENLIEARKDLNLMDLDTASNSLDSERTQVLQSNVSPRNIGDVSSKDQNKVAFILPYSVSSVEIPKEVQKNVSCSYQRETSMNLDLRSRDLKRSDSNDENSSSHQREELENSIEERQSSIDFIRSYLESTEDQPEEIVKPVGGLVCDYCQSGPEKNRFGQQEDLLICKDCGNKAHPSCLSYSQELVEQIRSDGSWQCIDCKACVVCDGTGDPDTLLFCDACDKGYHMNCHTPKLDQMPTGKWACSSCITKGKSVATVSNQQVFVIDDEEEPEASDVTAVVAMDEDTVKNKTVHNSNEISIIAQKLHSNKPALLPVSSVPQNTTVPQQQQPQFLQQHGNFMYRPAGMLPSGVMSVPVQPGHHMGMQLPINQPQMVPVSYVIPSTVPQQQPPQPQSHPSHVLGKGMQNNMSNILNPTVPLPDVRSAIREDVLRALPLDVADWTVKDVGYYFKSHGYIEEGALLQEQEIDGRALLLMSRNDCLTGLRIKLGPALKIYHMHIHKLQMRTDFLG